MPYQFRSSSDQTLLLATEGNRQVLYDLTLPNRTKSLEIDRSWRVNFARWGREQNWIYLTQAHHSSQTSTQIKQLNFDLMTISEYSVDPILRESQIVGTTKQQELVLYANQGLHGLTRLPSHPTHPKKAGSIVNWSFNISDKSPKITRVSDEIDSLKPIQERRPTFLYLSGPHRKYTFGLEEGFFQHCVVGYLSALAESEHINVFLHNESVKDSSPLFGYEALGQLVKQVQILTHGAPIVLCSSSLGVLSLLQLLHYSSDIAGAVLINPVYQLKSIGTVKQLSDEVADSFVDSEEVARHIKSKILIFHSASDSVVPYQATSKFLEQIPDSCFKRYITLYDEDHVITNYDSWNTIYHETKRFLKSEIA
jgi:predicted alpha/beta hydrolase family esterase